MEQSITIVISNNIRLTRSAIVAALKELKIRGSYRPKSDHDADTAYYFCTDLGKVTIDQLLGCVDKYYGSEAPVELY
jgi:hypothetical protein